MNINKIPNKIIIKLKTKEEFIALYEVYNEKPLDLYLNNFDKIFKEYNDILIYKGKKNLILLPPYDFSLNWMLKKGYRIKEFKTLIKK